MFFFFQAEDGIRDLTVTGVQTCALPIFKNCVAAVKRLPYPLTNDHCAGIEVLTQDAYAADFSLRRDGSDDAGNSGAVAEKVGSIARPRLNVQPRINNVNIVPKL